VFNCLLKNSQLFYGKERYSNLKFNSANTNTILIFLIKTIFRTKLMALSVTSVINKMAKPKCYSNSHDGPTVSGSLAKLPIIL
jgi:hypothetical protein